MQQPGRRPEGRYRIGSNPRVWIFGLSKPVSVDCPACAGREFSADGIICPFDLKIDDSVLLRELQLVAARARVAAWAWETLSIEIRASDFAVFSLTDSDENVMERRAVNVRLIPMTEIAVEFGDVAKLSPWCVRQRWPDSREPVVLREALRAVNASAASYDAMPYETFCFATNGVLRSVSRRSVAGNGMADAEDGIFLGIRLVGKVGKLDERFAKRLQSLGVPLMCGDSTGDRMKCTCEVSLTGVCRHEIALLRRTAQRAMADPALLFRMRGFDLRSELERLCRRSGVHVACAVKRVLYRVDVILIVDE